jgi:hypothetical protein
LHYDVITTLGCGTYILDYVSIEAPDHERRLDALMEVLCSDDGPQMLAQWDGVPKVDDCRDVASMWRRLVCSSSRDVCTQTLTHPSCSTHK